MSERNKVVVIGAGIMGHGIAHAFATASHDVTLVDVNEAALAKAKAKIADIVAGGVKLGKVTEEVGQRTLAGITTSLDLKAASADADLVIETATEILDVKLDIVRAVDSVLPSGAILATNTSALSVTEIASVFSDPARVIGMHFFSPVHKMKLLELVAGLETSADTIAKSRAYGDAIGKSVILVNDSPGLTTSRMSAMMGNEAMWMLQEGVASAEDIDTAMRTGFNHPMGPLELGDNTGWDTRLKVIQYLHSVLGEKFRPCPLIAKMVKSGRIGKKAGAGVYRYDADGKKILGSGLTGNAL